MAGSGMVDRAHWRHFPWDCVSTRLEPWICYRHEFAGIASNGLCPVGEYLRRQRIGKPAKHDPVFWVRNLHPSSVLTAFLESLPGAKRRKVKAKPVGPAMAPVEDFQALVNDGPQLTLDEAAIPDSEPAPAPPPLTSSAPVAAKVAHVLQEAAKPAHRPHTCHAIDCPESVPPALFMCKRHWSMVPKHLQRGVWREYQIAQERGEATVSKAYLDVANQAIQEVARKEHNAKTYPAPAKPARPAKASTSLDLFTEGPKR